MINGISKHIYKNLPIRIFLWFFCDIIIHPRSHGGVNSIMYAKNLRPPVSQGFNQAVVHWLWCYQQTDGACWSMLGGWSRFMVIYSWKHGLILGLQVFQVWPARFSIWLRVVLWTLACFFSYLWDSIGTVFSVQCFMNIFVQQSSMKSPNESLISMKFHLMTVLIIIDPIKLGSTPVFLN